MTEFSKKLAVEGFRALSLAPENRRLVKYWLSLWEGDELPERRKYEPSTVRDLLPGIAIMEIKAGSRLRMRFAGSAVNAAMGVDAAGRDILEMTSGKDREIRLARNSMIAEGAAGWAVRQGTGPDRKTWRSEEIYLPFRDLTEDGARLVLMHMTWRPSDSHSPIVDVAKGIDLVEEFGMIELRPQQGAAKI